jgi:hypothetical protein
MKKISNKNYEKLFKKILEKKFYSNNDSEALVYSLMEIEKSINIVYEKILPILLEKNMTKEAFLEMLWDIREEFRHIDYHIKDGKLLDL